MSFILGRAAAAIILTAALTGIAAADPVIPGGGGGPAKVVGPTAMVKGQISGGTGVKLNCSSINVEFHDSKGNVVTTAPTTATKTGACAYNTAIPAMMMLSACPGSLTKGSLLNAFTPATSKTFDSKLGRESLGTLGTMHLYSNVVSLKALGAGAVSSTDEITVSQGK
jgi:hypothetical protein